MIMLYKKELSKEEKRENRIDWLWAIYNTLRKRPDESNILFEELYGKKVPYGENEMDGTPFWNVGKLLVLLIFICIIALIFAT